MNTRFLKLFLANLENVNHVGSEVVWLDALSQDFYALLTIAYNFFLNCGELFFEASKVLVKCPHKGLVGPEGRLRAFFRGTWRAKLCAVTCDLIYELLQPEHSLAVHSDMLQNRAQTILW